jgi:hypothetical protein
VSYPRKVLSMQRSRQIALALILLSGWISIFWGCSLERSLPNGGADFKGLYLGTRCLLQGRDPYSQGEMRQLYGAEDAARLSDTTGLLQVVIFQVYLPTTYIVIAPFAVLRWGIALAFWMAIIAVGLIVAAVLTWDLGADFSPRVSLVLICIVLANSEVLFAFANAAGVAISLCVIAVWCFLRERFVPAGVLCFAISLAIKPHDTGLVWLFFLLAGGIHRERALKTLAVVAVLSVPAILWVSLVAPHWTQEMHSNLLADSAQGGINNPGPGSVDGRVPNSDIDLQTVISIFKDDPHIYNPISYLICGVLLLGWAFATLRFRFSPSRAWLALAAIAPLSMLPLYHRHYDTKLLLLTVPACAILWSEGGLIAWIALLATTAELLLTGDIPLGILGFLTRHLHCAGTGATGKILQVLSTRPSPLILFIVGTFYSCLYLRRAGDRV